MEWVEKDSITPASDNAELREFSSIRGDRPVTGVLWVSKKSKPGAPLILLGHGASGNRHQTPIPILAEKFCADHGFNCLSIDGPVHGRRQVGPGGRAAFWPEWQRPGNVEDMIADWQHALDHAQALLEVGTGPVGYWGLSMGTVYGGPLVGAEKRIKAAVLGLMGISGPDHYKVTIKSYAVSINCPVLFIVQLEDELFTRHEQFELFDLIAASDKRMHANPGLHPNVPAEELRHSVEFLVRQLTGNPEPRDAAFRISE